MASLKHEEVLWGSSFSGPGAAWGAPWDHQETTPHSLHSPSPLPPTPSQTLEAGLRFPHRLPHYCSQHVASMFLSQGHFWFPKDIG